jgi:hypothetical protein
MPKAGDAILVRAPFAIAALATVEREVRFPLIACTTRVHLGELWRAIA